MLVCAERRVIWRKDNIQPSAGFHEIHHMSQTEFRLLQMLNDIAKEHNIEMILPFFRRRLGDNIMDGKLAFNADSIKYFFRTFDSEFANIYPYNFHRSLFCKGGKDPALSAADLADARAGEFDTFGFQIWRDIFRT